MAAEPMTLEQLASLLGAEVHCNNPADAQKTVTGIAPIDHATSDQISFVTNPKYFKHLESTQAGAIILGAIHPECDKPQLIHKNPYAAMAKTSQHFHPLPPHSFQGQSELAFIHPEANVDPSAIVYPFAFIDQGATVGAGSVIYPHVTLGPNCSIGKGTILYSGVTVQFDCQVGDRCIIHASCVIGGDGFGFAPAAEGNVKIPQIGRAIIEDDVELQPGCTVDRGAYDDTIVGKGTKMDDQVLIAHGVQMGPHCLVAGQGAIAGSTKIGERFIMAGSGAVGPSLTIAPNVIGGPKVGINSSITESGEYMGFPQAPAKEWRRKMVGLKKLPDLIKTVQNLERQVEELQKKLGE